MMDENQLENAEELPDESQKTDEAVDMSSPPDRTLDPASDPFMNGEIRTLDGEVAGDGRGRPRLVSYRFLYRLI